MFDLQWLPEATASLVLVSDTHEVLHPEAAEMQEFASRAKQTARTKVALQMAAALPCDQRLHLGDLIQSYPESPDYEQAVASAHRTLIDAGFACRVVAGNQDVGDKADPTMPSNPVTPQRLAEFHQRFGCSWYDFALGPVHCLVINSQILNRPDLAEAGQQREWLEQTLAQHAGRRHFLFLHLPLYLGRPDEPGLGHYDNVGQPDRAWLLKLIEQYGIERIYSGHVHWRFCDWIGQSMCETVASTSFTRPGFGHALTSKPAPEQGRDDAPKLGFYWIRVGREGVESHLIRTHGWTQVPGPVRNGTVRWLVTRTSLSLPRSPVGVTLRHSLTPTAVVPAAWPSVVRQPVRNDYPLLSLREAGVRHLRVPVDDLLDGETAVRLRRLRQEGVGLTVTPLWEEDRDALIELAKRHAPSVRGLEVRIPGGKPGVALLEALGAVRQCAPHIALSLSPVLPNDRVEGKQHVRTRLGYRLDEVDGLNAELARADVKVERVVCRPDANASLWTFFRQLHAIDRWSHIEQVDVLVELTLLDDERHAERIAEAMLGAALCKGVRLFFDPLIDFDRTMDVSHGLLDSLCNPRPAFHVLRMLNTLLFASPSTIEPLGVMHVAADRPAVRQADEVWTLVRRDESRLNDFEVAIEGTGYGLTTGWVTADRASLSRTLQHLQDEQLWLWRMKEKDARQILGLGMKQHEPVQSADR